MDTCLPVVCPDELFACNVGNKRVTHMKVELLFADVTYLCLITVFLPITMYAIAFGYL